MLSLYITDNFKNQFGTNNVVSKELLAKKLRSISAWCVVYPLITFKESRQMEDKRSGSPKKISISKSHIPSSVTSVSTPPIRDDNTLFILLQLWGKNCLQRMNSIWVESCPLEIGKENPPKTWYRTCDWSNVHWSLIGNGLRRGVSVKNPLLMNGKKNVVCQIIKGLDWNWIVTGYMKWWIQI